jgi:hypothetical protein
MPKIKMDKDPGDILDDVLKQYSVVRVGNATGAIHGKDYKEMKKVIIEALFDRDSSFFD